MPDISAIQIAIVVIAVLIGIVLGWIVRGSRSQNEKNAINAGWAEQIDAQRNEHQRLLEQNKSLMEQNTQFQASNKDSKMRAAELSDALKEAFERRDELQRQIKDIRGNLETAVSERDQLQSDMQSREAESDVASTALQRRDEKIAKLRKELDNWQQRVPPLIEKFRLRNEEAQELEQQLADAQQRIAELEVRHSASDETRIEPVDQDALTDGMDASNEPIGDVVEEADDDDGEDALESFIDDQEFQTLVGAIVDDAADHRDDLKAIKGIGPSIEKTLNEMGIFRLKQIAELTEYDIDRVAGKLKGFRTRIYREDWLGQARALIDQRLVDQP
ncbi:MAG: hypothetical protein KJO82_09610 [Gammaproteobacteria bacterium]|nr:hypothetical protein [Gammaproteobacteria bacterium]